MSLDHHDGKQDHRVAVVIVLERAAEAPGAAAVADALEHTARELRAVRPGGPLPAGRVPRVDDFAALMRRVEAEVYDAA